jgi:DNA-binding PadR family transcriptional regulator
VDLVRVVARGAVAVHVLHHACVEEVHGAALMVELGRHGHRLGPGTLYPILHRLEHNGLLSSHVVVVDGHQRRVYVATRAGRAAYRRCQSAIQELADEVLER